MLGDEFRVGDASCNNLFLYRLAFGGGMIETRTPPIRQAYIIE
ncbi:hypothetical protein SB861_32935 [Paraburkholderia sp. SIMBA_049]